jgi:hypothetical protein
MRTLFAVIALAHLVCLTLANPTGIRFAVGENGLNYFAETIVAIINTKFNGAVSVPTVDFKKDDVEGSISNIVISDTGVGDISFVLQSGNTASLTISGFHSSINADFDAHTTFWPHIGGHGGVSASAGGTFQTTVTASTTSDGHVQLTSDAVSVDISSLDIHFSGGLTSLILNVIKDLFGGLIRSSIEKMIDSKFGALVSTDLNAALAQIKTVKTFAKAPYNNTEALIGFEDLSTTASYISAGLEGYLVPVANPSAIPPFSVVTMPDFYSGASDAFVQVMVSAFTVESLAWGFIGAGALQHVIPPSAVPANAALQLNTNDPAFLLIAPGMVTRYPNMNIQIDARVQQGVQVSSATNDDSFAVSAPLTLALQPLTPQGPADAFILGCTFSTSLKVSISNQTAGGNANAPAIVGEMEYLQCPLAVQNSTVGPVKIGVLADVLNYLLPNVLVPLINQDLAIGFPLPSSPAVSLQQTSISFEDNYVVFGTAISINPNDIPINVTSTSSTEHVKALPMLYDTDTPSLRGAK